MTARLSHILIWLPLAAIVAAIVLSAASGRGLVQESAGSVITVTGNVDSEIFLDAAGCTAGSVNIGELIPADPWKTAQDNGGPACAIGFGTTNHPTGTTLSMLEDPSATATPADAMKCLSGTCAGNALPDFENVAAEPAAGTPAFGAQLLSATGVASALWNVAPAVYDVQDAAASACTTGVVGTGTCAFTWGATASAASVVGSYQAQARMVVLAN